MKDPVFSIYNKDGKYFGNEPFFYNANEFEWTKFIEYNWQIILEELVPYIETRSPELTPYFHKTLIKQGNWKTLNLLYWSIQVPENYKKFPKTVQLFEKIPNLVSASFSLLEPHTIISPHHGDTNAIIRCHLGLVIPDTLPSCGMEVGTEKQSWENGKLMLFSDVHEHSAFNNTDHPRYIFLFDVLKQEYASRKLYVCSGVLAQLSLLFLSEKLKIKRLAPRALFILHKLARLAFTIAIPIKNKIVALRQKS
jgi:aspartyl/asparaginyl beta-hydroxylase (cupin superfamily)